MKQEIQWLYSLPNLLPRQQALACWPTCGSPPIPRPPARRRRPEGSWVRRAWGVGPMVRRVLGRHVSRSICECAQLTESWGDERGMVYVNASWIKIAPPTMNMPTTVEPAKNAVYLANRKEVRTTESGRLGGVAAGVVELNLI